MDLSKKMKVLSPCSGKDGKTWWRTAGVAHANKDGSINLYLDMLPVNGRLQIREWEEQDRRGGVGENLRFGPALDAVNGAQASGELPF